MKDTTQVNHPPEVEVPADNRPVVAPIYQTVKFEFESVEEGLRSQRGERPGFSYLRNSNPTTRQLELTLAQLQGREDCVVCASGVGVIAQALLSLTRAGRSCAVLHRDLWTDAPSGAAHAGEIWRYPQYAVDRGSCRR